MNQMKSKVKYFLLLLIPALFMGAIITSCEEEEAGGPSEIQYIRVTNPEKSDSLLNSAYMGSLIAIMGEGLGNVVEVWFNDQEASLTSTYITDRSILVNVPNIPPQTVTNLITLVFKNGTTYEYPFTVNVPAPRVSSIKCEYVAAGDVAIITGDFFFEPKVIFPGDVEGVIVSYKQNQIQVTVPEGAESGPVTVETLFGSTKSSFYFRDQRGLFWDFDALLGVAGTPGKHKVPIRRAFRAIMSRLKELTRIGDGTMWISKPTSGDNLPDVRKARCGKVELPVKHCVSKPML